MTAGDRDGDGWSIEDLRGLRVWPNPFLPEVPSIRDGSIWSAGTSESEVLVTATPDFSSGGYLLPDPHLVARIQREADRRQAEIDAMTAMARIELAVLRDEMRSAHRPKPKR